MLPELKTMLVLNPHAGGGRGRKIFPAVRERLGSEFRNMEVRVSAYAGQAFEIGREAARGGFERVLTVGGDGTPFEVVNGLYADGRPRSWA
jgi:diacylglycerol kinase (ATP)